MPQTDIHKLVGFIVGVLAGYAAKYGLDVPADIQTIITFGVSLLVMTLVGKRTNPTGANASEARQALEAQTGTGSGK